MKRRTQRKAGRNCPHVSKPLTLKKTLKYAGIILLTLPLLGTSPKTYAKPVFHASTLSPQSVVVTPVEPVVEETVEQASVDRETTRPVSQQSVPTTDRTDVYSGQVSGSTRGLSGLMQCTDYISSATGYRQNGNAGTWRANTTTPSVGGIQIFSPGEQGAGALGHVAVVRAVQGNRVYVQESNFGNGVGSYRWTANNGRFAR